MPEMWCLIACGQVADGAEPELRSRVAELLSSPEFGTGHSQLVMGSTPRVDGLHLAGGERAPEPAAV